MEVEKRTGSECRGGGKRQGRGPGHKHTAPLIHQRRRVATCPEEFMSSKMKSLWAEGTGRDECAADLGAMRVPPVCAPRHRTARDPSLPGWPVVQEPGRTCRGPQAMCQALGPVHSPQRGSCTLVPGSWGQEKQRPGVESLFASGAAGQAEGLLLVEVAGHAG